MGFLEVAIDKYCYFPLAEYTSYFCCSDKTTGPGANLAHFGNSGGDPLYYLPLGASETYKFSPSDNFTLLMTKGEPVFELSGSSSNLGNSIVQVKPSDDDNNNGGYTPPTPQTPNNWEIWQTLTDLLTQIDTGEITNGGTTMQEFVNNNYNYVDVNINVPDNTNVNISGGLDIKGSGNVDITIHEDISLPSAGDGSGFFNPNAVDVIAALSTNNPVIKVIAGLFEALDPALVGIFSVSVSSLLVLGLWKLLRG